MEKKNLTKKVLNGHLNSWKFLPIGSLINFDRGVNEKFQEIKEGTNKLIKHDDYINSSKYLLPLTGHSSYAVIGSFILTSPLWL